MSLILEGLSLVLEAGGLAMDCACCIKEKCEAIACVKDIDCDEAGKTPDAECFCRKKNCTSNPACQGDEDCPDGQECVDGVCVSKCRGQPCGADGDCPEECVCLEGGCWDEDNVYYCHGDPDDSNADGECKQGVPQVSKGGPYLTYGLCAQSGCKSKFSCNPVVCDCYPDAAGTYEDLVSCQQECCDGSGDLGRCCESRVTYDVNGDVTNVTQGEAQPCCSLGNCTKDQCISDDRLPNGQAGERVFRQFNSLFSNCDLCPTVDIGPCCYEENGVPTCGMHDKGFCEDVLDGEWKGNNWFDCENARDPDVDLLIDFACPDCNGAGDCSCGGNEYCYGQECLDCNNITTVNKSDFVIIDIEPKAGDKWKFRSRDCENGVSTQNESIDIYAERPDGSMKLLTIVNNVDGEIDSFGRTLYTLENTECFLRLKAQKTAGAPDEAKLCMEKTAAGNPLPPAGCVLPEGLCSCPDPEFDCPDNPDLAYSVRTFGPMNAPPADRWKWIDESDAASVCRAKYVFRWFSDQQTNGVDVPEDCGDFESSIFIEDGYSYATLMMWKPGSGWVDVTDEYVEGLPWMHIPSDTIIPNGLRFESVSYQSGCDGTATYITGSDEVYQGFAPPPCEIPDLNANCPQRNIRSENPLP